MKIVHTTGEPWVDALVRGPFAQRRKELGGGQRLSCGLWELAPGKRSFPMHAHLITDEALFVISGNGKVRTPDGLTDIAAGDFVAFPAGGPAHQLVNDGPGPLVYVAMSAVSGVDVVQYTDSKKLGVATGTWPNLRRWMFREDEQHDYFEGELGE